MRGMKQSSIVWAAVALALGVAGCSKEEAPAEEKKDPVVERMQNPEYVRKLDHQRDTQKAAVRDLSKARAAYDAAKKAGADDAELTRLSNAWVKAAAAFADHQKATRLIVREEMLKQGVKPPAPVQK